MKYLKLFEEYSENGRELLIRLITDDGEIINKEGYAEEGIGIFGDDGKEYPAGLNKDGELFASQVDTDDKVLRLDGIGHVKNFKVGEKYLI